MGEITTGIKLAIGGAILAVIAIVAAVLYFQHKDIGTLNQNIGAASSVIAEQSSAASNAAVTIQNQQQTAAITDAATTNTASAVQANTSTQTGVEQNTDKQIDVINQQYVPPAPPANIAPQVQAAVTQAQAAQAAKATAISKVQIDSLWTTFCNTTPDSVAQCAAAPAPASTP